MLIPLILPQFFLNICRPLVLTYGLSCPGGSAACMTTAPNGKALPENETVSTSFQKIIINIQEHLLNNFLVLKTAITFEKGFPLLQFWNCNNFFHIIHDNPVSVNSTLLHSTPLDCHRRGRIDKTEYQGLAYTLGYLFLHLDEEPF